MLFYNPGFYAENLAEIPAVWKGGMSFHGGLVGAALGVIIFARRHKVAVMSVADLASAAATPIGLCLGRIANFIKPELWGRPTDVPWAMIFPGAGPLPRHPSQLYEAGLEGLALFILLYVAIRLGGLAPSRPRGGPLCHRLWVARIFCEFFREPDPQLGFLFGGATMGMFLSLPLIVAGILCLLYAWQKNRAKAAP